MAASITLPNEVVCTTTELTERDNATATVLPEELKTAGFTVSEQVPKGAAAEAKTEQALEAAPTLNDTVTPLGEHWLRPIESVTE
jgi:hypothetical protein